MATDRRTVLVGGSGLGLSLLLSPAPGSAFGKMGNPAPPASSPRELLSLDTGWRFHSGDIAMPPLLDHEAAYSNAKAGNAAGAAATEYDDTGWQQVTLPHDFALDQPYERGGNPDEGYKPRGIGWYRRIFALAESDRGRHLELDFGGASTEATVWINGTLVHRSFTGFTGFTIDLTPFALYGDDLNTLAVRVDATRSEAWWYEGAGLYRHVTLVKRHALHIETDGVHADPRRGANGGWTVPVSVALAQSGRVAREVLVEVALLAPDGRTVTTGRRTSTVAALGHAEARIVLNLAEPPRLWSPDSPTLYVVRCSLLLDGATIDALDTRIGFRTLRFDAAQGFVLNDQPLKIQGVCTHQDHAGVGVAVPDSLWDFRLRRLKAMGANALRCAHNPPAAELLDAADRLGVLVMDEARNFNASEDYLPQLEWMVRRDRNHPSVILWSLCNEESLQSSQIGVEMIRRMKAVVRTLDDSRPVTAAMNGGQFATLNIGQELDVVGFNYGMEDYDRFHAENPHTPMMSSEDGSAYMTRGAFATDMTRHVLSSYDDEHASFGASFRHGWELIAKRPYLAGGFLWTGFDYRGEPSPFEWPTASASFGAMDLCGFAKTAFHIRRALWVKDTPVLEIAPHWTWPGREGQPIKVMAITNADRVVLSLNGQVVADLAVDPFAMATCDIPYAPGRLAAVAYRNGKAVAHTAVETTGQPARLRLTPDRARIDGDGRDAMPITVELLDEHGRAIPTADVAVVFTADGGAVLGMGNGDPNSHEPDRPVAGIATRRLYNGLAQVIATADRTAAVLTLSATAPGLRPALLRIPVRRVAAQPEVAVQPNVQSLTEWRTSPPSVNRPDMGERVADGDMNSWGWLKPGSTQAPYGRGRYYRFQVAFTPRPAIRDAGGLLVFGRLVGRSEIWIDGTLVLRKDDPRSQRVSVPFAGGPGSRVVTVLFDAPAGSAPYGIAGSVKVEPAK
jgi:beta-galactosidase